MVEEWNNKCPKCGALIEDIPIVEEPINFTQERYLYECNKCKHNFWVKQIDVLVEDD